MGAGGEVVLQLWRDVSLMWRRRAGEEAYLGLRIGLGACSFDVRLREEGCCDERALAEVGEIGGVGCGGEGEILKL